jgi:hypothetical protein
MTIRNFPRLGTGFVAGLALVALSGAGGAAAAGQSGFSKASLNGSYAGIFSGTIPHKSGTETILGTGVFIADGKGHLSGKETYTLGTQTCEATLSGTYTVGSDGRGTDNVTFTATTAGCAGGTYTQSLVIAGGGSLVLLANTNGQQIQEQWYIQQ